MQMSFEEPDPATPHGLRTEVSIANLPVPPRPSSNDTDGRPVTAQPSLGAFDEALEQSDWPGLLEFIRQDPLFEQTIDQLAATRFTAKSR